MRIIGLLFKMNGGVIVVEDDPDVIHVDNSSDLALSTSLNDLEIKTLHIDGQSIDVDAPLDIIDVVDEDDDIIDEEDPIPHDLADFDDEDLVNLDIDMSTYVARGHGGDGGGDDRPPPYQFEVDGRETLMPLGHHAAHWANYLGELVRELPLHYPSWRQMLPEWKARVVAKIGMSTDVARVIEVTVAGMSIPLHIRELPLHYPSWRQMPPEWKAGVVAKIGFDVDGRETLMPLGHHAAHWANYLGELVRELPLHYPSWSQMPPEWKARVVAKIGAALKERYWVPEEDGSYDLERIRGGRPSHISEADWDEQLAFGMILRTLPGLPKINKTRKRARIYNRRTKKIMETMNVSFDELLAIAFEQRSSKPGLNSMTSGHISSGLNLTYAPSTITMQQPSKGELDLLFESMYDDYIGGQPSATTRTVPPA
nr:hypothetical protein [Tanacetum cinerariifolium]